MRALIRRAATAALIVAALAATTSVALAGPKADLSWAPCPDGLPAPLECATIKVPLDYRDPGGRQIDIAISRIKARTPEQRLGVLLLNPGGPGAPGLPTPLERLGTFSAAVTDRYDLIGFDPRGVWHSAPVSCELSTGQLDITKTSRYPAPDGDIADSVAYARQVAQQCAAHSGALLPHITSANTARDMDRIRIALGEEKIAYTGVSGGAYLGAVYATLFPRPADRIVLDGVLGPYGPGYPAAEIWGPATAQQFPTFTRWAAARDAEYGLGETPEAVRDTYVALAATLDTEPLLTPSGTFTGNLLRNRTWHLLRDEEFAEQATMWRVVKVRDAQAAAKYTAAPPPELVPILQTVLATNWAISCNDGSWPASPLTYQQRVSESRKLFPVTNGQPANIWPCAFWSAKSPEAPVRITAQGPTNVLLTQGTRDIATPLAGAKAMRYALGDRSRLVTVDSGQHGVYPEVPNKCLHAVGDAFLVDGKLPAGDVQCAAESPKRAGQKRPARFVSLPL